MMRNVDYFRKTAVISLAIVGLLVLSACMTRLQKLKAMEPVGIPFSVALTQEYLAFAESEADQYDWLDSSYFARKGLETGYGELARPEKLEDWDIPEPVYPAFVQARRYLMEILRSDVITTHPDKAAQAQVFFDCWLEQQEETWQDDDIRSCREGFYDVLDELYLVLYPTKQPVQMEAKEVTLPQPSYVYFEYNKTTLDKNAQEVLHKLVAQLREVPQFKLTLNGYADRSGKPAYNMQLSKKRALAVKKVLVDAGLNSDDITIFAFGETAPLKATKDGKAARENRVVEVVVE